MPCRERLVLYCRYSTAGQAWTTWLRRREAAFPSSRWRGAATIPLLSASGSGRVFFKYSIVSDSWTSVAAPELIRPGVRWLGAAAIILRAGDWATARVLGIAYGVLPLLDPGGFLAADRRRADSVNVDRLSL